MSSEVIMLVSSLVCIKGLDTSKLSNKDNGYIAGKKCKYYNELMLLLSFDDVATIENIIEKGVRL